MILQGMAEQNKFSLKCRRIFCKGGGGGGTPAVADPPKTPKYAQYGQQANKTASAIQANSRGTNSTDVTKGKVSFGLGTPAMDDNSLITPLGLGGNSKLKKNSLLGLS